MGEKKPLTDEELEQLREALVRDHQLWQNKHVAPFLATIDALKAEVERLKGERDLEASRGVSYRIDAITAEARIKVLEDALRRSVTAMSTATYIDSDSQEIATVIGEAEAALMPLPVKR